MDEHLYKILSLASMLSALPYVPEYKHVDMAQKKKPYFQRFK